MKLSDFKLLKVTGSGTGEERFFAEVSMETGRLWWKKSVRRPVCKLTGEYWFFADTGEFTPDLQVEQLWRAFLAQKDFKRK